MCSRVYINPTAGSLQKQYGLYTGRASYCNIFMWSVWTWGKLTTHFLVSGYTQLIFFKIMIRSLFFWNFSQFFFFLPSVQIIKNVLYLRHKNNCKLLKTMSNTNMPTPYWLLFFSVVFQTSSARGLMISSIILKVFCQQI